MQERQAKVSEIEPALEVKDTSKPIRVFSLSLNGVTVELCSIGASITKIILPKSDGSTGIDDIVLGYKSPVEMYESGNPPFLGVIVGRVANRIGRGIFSLDGNDYKVAINSDTNHLHGGVRGFSRCLWDMEIVEEVPTKDGCNGHKGVKCSLLSPDGDQGYPGSILVTAIYTLVPSNDSGTGVLLRLNMTATLQGDKPTPINLAQHTYFNLGGHDNPDGILEHKLKLACNSFTPTDATFIPTRSVVKVEDDPAMDLRKGTTMRDSLKLFAVSKAGLTNDDALKHVQSSLRSGSTIAKSGANCLTPGQPYGFDHNYLVHSAPKESGLSLVGSVEHEESKRVMKVYTTAPGVQVYTGNYLDGVNPSPQICKDGAVYGQWQGFCLETQTFPDGIMSLEEEATYPEFSQGKCFILRPGGADYTHTVAYSFETMGC